MASAFSGAEANAPYPADVACDYYAVLDSLFHPGQGKRLIDAIVKTDRPDTNKGFVIQLVATY